MSSWVETYRGVVYRWEVDHVDHLTVAYYLARFSDAGAALLERIGLGPLDLVPHGQACVTVDCYIRYFRELRVGDIMHVLSGVIRVDEDGLLLGHKLFDSENGALCTTVEQEIRHVQLAHVQRARAQRARARGRDPVPSVRTGSVSRRPAPFTAAQRRAAGNLRVDWDGPPRDARPHPRGAEGFRESARDTVKPWEIDVSGRSTLSSFIHRFAGANAHTIAAFGMTPAYQREERRGFSTFEFRFAIPGDVHAGDVICVRSALVHVGTTSLRILHRMYRDRTGELIASLEQAGVHLDTAARRPVPLPDSLRAKAQALLVA